MMSDHIINTLCAVGPATTPQLATILPSDRSHLARQLRQLQGQHVVTRELWRGASVWSLTRSALTAVAQQQGYPASVGAWLRLSGYSSATRSHDLGVVDVLRMLIVASDPPHHGVLDWKGAALSGLDYAHWQGPGDGEAKVARVGLVPDATLEYVWQDPHHTYYLRALLEYDMGTERPAILERKAERYWAARHPAWFTLLIITHGGHARLRRLLDIFRAALPDAVPVLGTVVAAGADWLSPRWIGTPSEHPVALQAVAQVLDRVALPPFWGVASPGTRLRDRQGRFLRVANVP